MRFLSSPSGMPSPGATVSVVQQIGTWARHNPTIIAVVLGMTLVMYGFYRGSVRLMKFFFNVSDKQIFTMGFAGGIIAAIALAGAVIYTQRRVSFHVDDVFNAAIVELRKHDIVTDKLGGLWRPGGFKGYSVESIQEAIQGSDRRQRSSYFEAPARRVQMIFMIRGLDRDAMVSLEAYKRQFEFHFEMLSLDLKANPRTGLQAEHIFLAGSSDHVVFQDLTDFMNAASKSGRKDKTMDDENMEDGI